MAATASPPHCKCVLPSPIEFLSTVFMAICAGLTQIFWLKFLEDHVGIIQLYPPDYLVKDIQWKHFHSGELTP